MVGLALTIALSSIVSTLLAVAGASPLASAVPPPLAPGTLPHAITSSHPVSYTHLTLPTNLRV